MYNKYMYVHLHVHVSVLDLLKRKARTGFKLVTTANSATEACTCMSIEPMSLLYTWGPSHPTHTCTWPLLYQLSY